MGLPSTLFSTSSINKKNVLLIFREMGLSGSNIKKFLVFFQKKNHHEGISHIYQKIPSQFSVPPSKILPEKNLLNFPKKNFHHISE